MERATFQIDANTTVPQLVVLRGMADHTDSVGRGEWRALAMGYGVGEAKEKGTKARLVSQISAEVRKIVASFRRKRRGNSA